MSTSIDVYVGFGYDLGGDDAGWRLEGLGQWDSFDDLGLPWCPVGTDDGEFDEIIEAELQRGRPEHEVPSVRVVKYQHPDFSQYALIITESLITYYHGHAARVLDPYTLQAQAFIKAWELDLRSALDRLGLTPIQGHGQWLLMSYRS